MIGQTYQKLLQDHPFFDLVYMPERGSLGCIEEAKGCELFFSALPSSVASHYDPLYAALGIPVFSAASCHRLKEGIPLIIPEINGELIPEKGIVAKPNCTLQSMVLPLYPLHRKFRLKKVIVTHLQSTSGAGAHFTLEKNILPFIEGEEEKSEREPLKIFGDEEIEISSQNVRVPVEVGHMSLISAGFEETPTLEEVLTLWDEEKGLQLPSSPRKLLVYFDEANRPQPALDHGVGGGMAVALGRLRRCPLLDIRFVALSNNLVRGGAGGGVLAAEYWRSYVKPTLYC